MCENVEECLRGLGGTPKERESSSHKLLALGAFPAARQRILNEVGGDAGPACLQLCSLVPCLAVQAARRGDAWHHEMEGTPLPRAATQERPGEPQPAFSLLQGTHEEMNNDHQPEREEPTSVPSHGFIMSASPRTARIECQLPFPPHLLSRHPHTCAPQGGLTSIAMHLHACCCEAVEPKAGQMQDSTKSLERALIMMRLAVVYSQQVPVEEFAWHKVRQTSLALQVKLGAVMRLCWPSVTSTCTGAHQILPAHRNICSSGLTACMHTAEVFGRVCCDFELRPPYLMQVLAPTSEEPQNFTVSRLSRASSCTTDTYNQDRHLQP